MSYYFDGFFAIDPDDPTLVASGGMVTLVDPNDASLSPLALTDPDGLPRGNPLQANERGFVPPFRSDLDYVRWVAGDLSGTHASYQGIKQDALSAASSAVEAQASAESSAGSALASQQAAEAAAAMASGPADTQVSTLLADPASATSQALDLRLTVVTPSSNGLMLGADKVKLDTYRIGATNVFGGLNAGAGNTGDRPTDPTVNGGYELLGLGVGALQTNQRGWKNTAVGPYAMRDNLDGYFCVAVGNSALERNVGGIGTAPKSSNDPGSRHTAVGSNALRYGTTGVGNVGVGRNAGHANLTGSYITAVGTNAWSGVVDDDDVHSAKTASYATAVGWGAGFNADAPQTTAIGARALYETRNPASYGCTAVGHYALLNSEARENTGLGNEAGRNVTTGRWTIAIGPRAVGSASAAVTGNANIGMGVATLPKLTSGQANIGLGQETLRDLESGSFNTIGGHQAAMDAPVALTGATGLGAGISVKHDNTIVLGRNTSSTAPNQATIGARHLEMLPSATPAAPASGGRLWIDTAGALKYMKSNGTTVTLAA